MKSLSLVSFIFIILYQLYLKMLHGIFKFTMVNADNTTKEQTKRSESMRHFVVKAVLLVGIASTIPVHGFSKDSIPQIEKFKKLYSTHKSNNKPDSVLHYSNLLIEQYKEKKDTLEVLKIYHETSEYLRQDKQYKLVTDLLKSYLVYAENSGNDEYIAKSYHQTARFLFFAEINNKMALEYYIKSLNILKNTTNYYDLSEVHFSLGLYYGRTEFQKKAIQYYLKSAEISKINEFNDLLYFAYRRIAGIYRHGLSDYKNSIDYHKKGLQVAIEFKDSSNIADSFIELGCVNLQYNKPDSVLTYYFTALEIAKNIHDNSILNFCYSHLSVYFETIKDYKKALYYLTKKQSNVIYGSYNWIPEPILKMAELEQKLGYHKSANKHYKKYIHLKDSLDKIKKADDFSNLELKFEFENIEKENQLKLLAEEEKSKAALQKQKNIRNYIILFSFLLMVIFFLIYRNYTDKQKTNKKLYEADKMKLRFFENISHELRTPLTLLISPLERVNAKLRESGGDNMIKLMLKNAIKLKSLINQLLDISKIDNKSLTIEKGLYDFNHVFSTVTAMFHSLAKDKNIEFQILSAQEKLIFPFDKERIEHVICNLLSNAFKFTPNGGKITATLSKLHDHLTISVKDTGIGISSHEIENVFDRFYQSSTGKNEPYEGTGIGLNIVKEYVGLHKGTIRVNSELGKGSEFTIILPLHKLNENINISNQKITVINETISEQLITKAEQTTKASETILIVEDNNDLRDYLKTIFCANYKVLEASNGEIGKQIASNDNPDIIISDIMMPICDGYCLTEFLKSQIETSHIPIILLTAKASQDDKIAGYKFGADDYLAKPFNESELKLKVQNTLTTRKKYRDKFKQPISVNPTEITANSLDQQFLINITKIVEANISNSDFTVEQFYQDAGLSQRNMYGKIKALTDMSPSQFIRFIRLKRAAQLLKQKSGNVSDIAFQTGFENLSYFTKCFKETFHKLPSEYK